MGTDPEPVLDVFGGSVRVSVRDSATREMRPPEPVPGPGPVPVTVPRGRRPRSPSETCRRALVPACRPLRPKGPAIPMARAAGCTLRCDALTDVLCGWGYRRYPIGHGIRSRPRSRSRTRTFQEFCTSVSIRENHHPWWRGLPARAKTTRLRRTSHPTGRMPVAAAATAAASAPGAAPLARCALPSPSPSPCPSPMCLGPAPATTTPRLGCIPEPNTATEPEDSDIGGGYTNRRVHVARATLQASRRAPVA
jgi:hypothetical protein